MTTQSTTESNLWWTLDQLPEQNKTFTQAWAKYALDLLRSSVEIAKTAAVSLTSLRNVSKTGSSGVFLSPGLDKQAASLFLMAEVVDSMLVQIKSNDDELFVTRLALAKSPINAIRYYPDQKRPNTIRHSLESFNPFYMVQEKISAYPDAVLLNAKGILHHISITAQQGTIVGVVGPAAFLTKDGENPPTGNDLSAPYLPYDQLGSTILLTEDAVHKIIGKLLDFATISWTQMVTEMAAYVKKNPDNDLPNLPPPPPMVVDVTTKLPDPEPGTGGVKVVGGDLPTPPSSKTPPPTGIKPGPSLIQIGGALLLAGTVGYGVWKLTEAMMSPRDRALANPK